MFLGVTRDSFLSKPVLSLEYECYESMALSQLKKLVEEVRRRFKEVRIVTISHRLGLVPAGEVSVFIGTASPHREHCLEATEWAINELKRTIPIWKKECYSDGTEWKQNKEWDKEALCQQSREKQGETNPEREGEKEKKKKHDHSECISCQRH